MLRAEARLSATAGFHQAAFPTHALSLKKPCHSVRVSAPVRVAHKPRKAAPPVVVPDPLFLFHCAWQWHKLGETAAGWELVDAMRSPNRGIRALAAELIAGTEDGRLLVRDLRRTRGGLEEVKRLRGPEVQMSMARQMTSPPFHPEAVENCLTCHLRKQGFYCALSPEVLQSFNSFSHVTPHRGGAILFLEGQTARGAFIVCSGKVKLSTTSKEGKVLVLKIAEPGEIIGLSAAISGESYEITAETVGPCLVNFVARDGLLRLMERSGELGLRSALAVSKEFQTTYRDIQELVLSRSSSGKLARLLLSWAGRKSEASSQELRIYAALTHEEMAQRIGASRETVTRLLSELRRKDLIALDGSSLVIKNRTALEAIAV